jgi:hypothetical protein
MMLTDEGDGFTLAPDLVEALGIEDFTKKRDYGRERGETFCAQVQQCIVIKRIVHFEQV